VGTGGHLAVFDVSAYVHTGMNSDLYANYTVQGFPMGGIKYFLKYMLLNLVNMSDVIVAFDDRSFRKDLLPDYKAGRGGANHSVNAQLEFLRENLLLCGIPAYKVYNLEADDLIFSAVEKNRANYNRIGVFSSDYDVCHNVDENVYFEAVNSNVNNVTFRNFSSSVERGEEIMLNTLSAYKTFCGCNSDKVPPFRSAKHKGIDLYKAYCQFLREGLNPYLVNVSRSKEAFLMFLDRIAGVLTDKEMEELRVRVEVCFPRMCDSVEFVGEGKQSINLDMLGKLLSLCNDLPGLRQINRTKTSLSEEEIQMFRKKAHELKTGEFAVDRNEPVDSSNLVNSEVLFLREFS
jgi:hypothetical protein